MDISNDLISSVYGRHPARAMSFDDVRRGLQEAVRAQNVVISREEGLEQYIYTNGCRFENRWDLFSLLARGLILDPVSRRVLATPFPKFFNFGEVITRLPDEPFEVTEKIDGSLGIIFEHNEQWRVATKGRITSEQALWATDFLRQKIDMRKLVGGTTYLVEIVYPRNRIVIPYNFEALFLLGGYDESGRELMRSELDRLASETGFRLVPSHTYGSLPELLPVARQLPRDREGFVVRFHSGLRIKLKGEQYCRIHKLISGCTPLSIWEAMMNGEDLDRLRVELPEEMTRDFDLIRRLLGARLEALVTEVRLAVDQNAHLPDKQVGFLIQAPNNGLTAAQRKFLFMARKARFFEEVRVAGDSRRKAFMLFRPDRNDLPGYSPSDALTRFSEESG
ncbi:MAG TPA: RNA ligase [Tepidisphaeraceae bacterium]|nr:RNA ligase [Tepidisphaeraceae bacterium]